LIQKTILDTDRSTGLIVVITIEPENRLELNKMSNWIAMGLTEKVKGMNNMKGS
jgi:hypothetical protein